MLALINYSGNNDIYSSPSKRVRATPPSLNSLPDECLFEILRRLPGEQARKDSACVSKRWLMLLSSIHKSEIIKTKSDVSLSDVENEGHLTRCLKGEKASDVNLAGISIGLSSRGGLGKLSIWGNESTTRLSNFGLSAIARGCPSLRKLSLWNVPSIGDEGVCEVAKECHLLEKLEIIECPSISDRSLIAIAQHSPSLCDITIESCQNLHNESLQAIAMCCPKLKSITIMNSTTIGDKGVESVFSSPGPVLSKLHLQGMSLTDSGLIVIANSGKEITCLKLIGLKFVTEKGFLALGNGQLNKLSSLVITSCPGVTDLSVSSFDKRCPSLKQITLRKCSFLSDNGLVAFAYLAASLNRLHLEECNMITLLGLLGTLSFPKSKLESLTIVKCLGIKDREVEISAISACESLRSLSLRRCPNFGSVSLAIVGKLCPRLFNIDFSGLSGITDDVLLPLVKRWNGLVNVDLNGCLNLSDEVALTIARVHGKTLKLLNLDGCVEVTDRSLVAIGYHSVVLKELYVSKCSITDFGISALFCQKKITLRVLSISGCSKVTNKSVPLLINLGKSLQGLNLQDCNSINSKAVEKLMASLRGCDILF